MDRVTVRKARVPVRITVIKVPREAVRKDPAKAAIALKDPAKAATALKDPVKVAIAPKDRSREADSARAADVRRSHPTETAARRETQAATTTSLEVTITAQAIAGRIAEAITTVRNALTTTARAEDLTGIIAGARTIEADSNLSSRRVRRSTTRRRRLSFAAI